MSRLTLVLVLVVFSSVFADQQELLSDFGQQEEEQTVSLESLQNEQEKNELEEEKPNETEGPEPEEDCSEESVLKCYSDVVPRSDPNFCKEMLQAQTCLEGKANACLEGDEKEEALEELKKSSETLENICGEESESESFPHCLGNLQGFKRQVMMCTLQTIFELVDLDPSEAPKEDDVACVVSLKITGCLKPYVERKCGEEFATELSSEIMKQLNEKLSIQNSPLCASAVSGIEDEEQEQQETQENEIRKRKKRYVLF